MQVMIDFISAYRVVRSSMLPNLATETMHAYACLYLQSKFVEITWVAACSLLEIASKKWSVYVDYHQPTTLIDS